MNVQEIIPKHRVDEMGPYKRFGHRSHTSWRRMADSKAQDVLDSDARRLVRKYVKTRRRIVA